MGFSLGGLISGAMRGVGEGMTTVAKGELENQQKLDYQKEILRLTEEKDRRVAEFQDDLTRRGKIKDINEIDPLKAESDANRTKVVGAAETEVLSGRERTVGAVKTDVEKAREEALRAGKIKTAADTKTAEFGVETDVTKARGSDSNYLKSKQRLTDAGEGSSAKASAASTTFDLNQKKEMAKVLEQLDAATDPKEIERLEQKFKRLSGGKYAARYEAVKVKNADGDEVTEILDKQTGYTAKPRSASSAGGKPAEADAHAAAQAAIAKGASKDAVNARLKQNGYNPLP